MAWPWWILIGFGSLAGVVLLLVWLADPGPMKYPVSDHFDGERFFMPEGRPVGNTSLGAVLKWQWEREPAKWPETVHVHPALPEARVAGRRIVATMVGHASVLVQTEGLNILTDPLWSERAGPFSFAGPKRVTEPGIRFEDLPKIDIVLVSHGHWDHLDVPTLKRLRERDRPNIFVPLGHGELLAKNGIEATELDWGQPVDAGPAKLEAVPVRHWTSRWGADRNRALWAGWQVTLPDGIVYFAGDTGYGDGGFFPEGGGTGAGGWLADPFGAAASRGL
ncbi:MBL fold metallo-hydrolase [Sandaracinobacteroides hominis]|uniref:MBL fold metallo-hydrolase n=1 Tax=Sandaracinobacteroides hominis TaxID=2780086 RepID=UPI0022A7DF8F|nr:MBL fold metallo-hydrolase [Sandaracinobacteroides hominis]